jgi:hypothetical protein
MTGSLPERRIDCPYCGEPLTLLLDVSAGEQTYIEDCAVCCRPIECRLVWRDGDWTLEVHREDD